MGAAIVDGGNPFGASKHLTGDGDGSLGVTPATGCTVISADSLETAAAAWEPPLNHGGQVQVLQAIEIS